MSIRLKKNKNGTISVTASAGEDLRGLFPSESPADFEARIRADESEQARVRYVGILEHSLKVHAERIRADERERVLAAVFFELKSTLPVGPVQATLKKVIDRVRGWRKAEVPLEIERARGGGK